ncbi:MAG: type II toxin-antitoxin system HicB family antitoxin [Erysipelotrichaceae bacterium]|nr:type II toxin-antitoxin system HicB family antitoxin [Erysipelotrichaceae bacterium]
MEISPDLDEGGYVISFPELPGCLTCGETIEQALKNAEDAKQEWYIAQMDD